MYKQLFLLAACFCLINSFNILKADTKPNFIIFYADDLGYGELGCQGNLEIPTPNIDSISKHGVRFTNGYVAATYCAPSRAGLMTGMYPTRFGFEYNPGNKPDNGLPLDLKTLPQYLKTADYDTIAIGKWHLGETPAHRPMARGFDEFYGTLANTPFFHPTKFIDSRISPDIQPITDDTFYTTDQYAQRAVDWLDKRSEKPWFIYLPFNAQHAPLQAPEKYLSRFPNIKDEKRRIFAAMLSAMDDAVGKVLEKVTARKQLDNTMVFFIADNGGPTKSTTSKNDPLKGYKMTTWEGGPRVPFMMQYPAKIKPGQTYELPVIQLDVLPTLLTAAGIKIEPAMKLDGVDLLPYINGEIKGRPHETLYWKYSPQWAVRHGDMKLVVAREGSGQPELYNLKEDISETTNLATSRPEVVEELTKLYNSWNAEQKPALWKQIQNAKPNQPKKKKQAT